MVVDGSQETDGSFLFIGGEHAFDEFHGGAGNDFIIGGGSDNILDGNGGIDTVGYGGSSTSPHPFNTPGPVDVDLALGTADNGWRRHRPARRTSRMSSARSSATRSTATARTTGSMAAAAPTTMTGGHGNDTYVVDNAGDVVTESSALAAGGTDTVESAITFTLGANDREADPDRHRPDQRHRQHASPTSSPATAATTSSTAALGADTMNGGLGNDTYVVDNAGDVVIEAGRRPAPTRCESAITYTLAAQLRASRS